MVKISRKENTIAFGVNVWKKLRQHVPNMRQQGYTIRLTETKYVTVKDYLGERYVMFVQVQASGYKRMINVKDSAWGEFLDALPEIDRVIPPQDVFVCSDCVTTRQVVKVDKNGRIPKSRLTQEQLKAIKESNAEAYRHGPIAYEQAFVCEYCGVAPEFTMQPDCGHCHRYDCKTCEPQNFCNTCGDNMMLAM